MPSSRPVPPLSPRHARVLGGIMAVCGIILITMMGGLLVLFAQAFLGYPTILGDIEFTGGPIMAGCIFALFAGILAFGIAGLYGGIWQIRHLRRDPRMFAVAQFSFTALTILGTVVSIVGVLLDR